MFYHSSTRLVEFTSVYIFLISKKAKETKEEKRTSVENLTGCHAIVCEFALCTFN